MYVLINVCTDRDCSTLVDAWMELADFSGHWWGDSFVEAKCHLLEYYTTTIHRVNNQWAEISFVCLPKAESYVLSAQHW